MFHILESFKLKIFLPIVKFAIFSFFCAGMQLVDKLQMSMRMKNNPIPAHVLRRHLITLLLMIYFN